MIIFYLFFLASAGLAVAPSEPPAEGVCQEDTNQHCGAAPAKPTWQEELEKTQRTWDVCQEDVNKFCEGIQVGENRLESCLKAHKTKLSKKCKKSLH